MRTVVHFKPEECVPDSRAVLAAEGMSGPGPASAETARMVEEARRLFRELTMPTGVCADISIAEFGQVFPGEGDNASDAVLARIFPRAERLALFACTVGARLTDDIRLRFERHDYALAYVLDAAASAGAERLADLVQDDYWTEVRNQKSSADYADGVPESAKSVKSVDGFALRYSPGYCGWNVSGQRKLFRFLQPEDIGITLRDSFLMEPLKSISGVFVLGPKELHRFENSFGYCTECRNPSCRERIAALDAK
jgi:hypothetical protein